MEVTKHIAIDFGASSGRVILGHFDGQKIQLEEIYRFANTPVEMNGVLYWDFPKLFQEIKNGLKAVSRVTTNVESLAIDTWGVDYGYIDAQGRLLLLPKNYRNEEKLKYQEALYEALPELEFYKYTGIVPSSINSYVQLYADIQAHPWLKDVVAHVLFMPDLFNYFLTQQININYSIASTSGLLSTSKKWSDTLFEKLGIPKQWFDQSELTLNKVLGHLTPSLIKETGLSELKVIASTGHDTAASILTVSPNAIFISCGTWSVIGIQRDEPIINEVAYQMGLTNEGTYDGQIKCLKNLNALWILQELQRYWSEQGHAYSFSELVKSAEMAHIDSFIDVEDAAFLKQENMYELIQQHLKATGQTLPETVGEWVRIVIQSIAMQYQRTILTIERLSGQSYDTVHMVGGGIQNALLCQLTAKYTGKKVVTGPIEASAMGNVLGQLCTLGLIKKTDIQQVVAASVQLKNYRPNEYV
ncbi:rhamnulokinase [Staphylococcus lutrae]|uniref:Rhamnulokinase n=1 Tax=Staphylococcus lutrae TaxID=155085 RepID=A0AAC9WKP4_9STAP|nr:rhamnulokinase [Staphylococcus lutrae]PNZ36663.1 rhamnulokinase [Staphylococcus lutrae]